MALGPIDYAGLQTQPNILQEFAQGYQLGNGLRQIQAQREQADTYAADLQAYMAQPSAQAASAFALKYPKFGEAVQKDWATLNTDQQQNELKDLGIVSAAFESGRPDIAASTLQRRIDAQKRAGMDTSQLDALAELIGSNPQQARAHVLAYTAAIPGGTDVLKNLATLGGEQRASAQAPAEVALKNASASKAVTEANIAQATAPATVQAASLKNDDTRSQIDNRAFQQQIDALDMQIKQAGSETQRGQLQLEREKLVLERDKMAQAQTEKATERATSAQDQVDTVNLGLGTINSILQSPGLKSALGLGGVGSVTGKISSWLPGSDRKDLEGLVDTLKSQQFLTGIKQMQAMGALSNAEGEKIGSAVASLNLDQSPTAFRNALGVIQKNLERSQSRVIGSGNLSTTNKSFVAKVPGIGNVTDGMVNDLLRRNPGATREQVMQFLQSQGGAR